MYLTLNSSMAMEKKECSEFKKFSKQHIACKAFNIKANAINAGGKIKKKTGKILKKTTGVFKKKQ